MLKAVIYEQTGEGAREVGEVILQRGIAEATNEKTRTFLSNLNVLAPLELGLEGDARILEPEDGEAYVSCIPYSLRGGMFWAELIHA